tara:strand:- start:445 stop:2529 length:2085 start_codon:yes stop_codon:yes gene_type:complete
MSKLLANQIANYNDNGPVEAKEGLNFPTSKPLQVDGSPGTSGQYLKSTGNGVSWQTFPTIPAAQVQVDWTATTGVTSILNRPNLAVVATSGSYNDLSNRPDVVPAQVNVNWNENDPGSKAFILNKPTLFSGSWTDLTNKPTIPATVNDLIDVDLPSPISDGTYIKWDAAINRWVASSGAAGLSNIIDDTTPQLGGNLDAQGFDIDGASGIIEMGGQSSKIRFHYDNFGAMPDPAQWHGMFAHVHSTGKAYYAHSGVWTELANITDIPADINTTYSQDAVADSTGVKLRLTSSAGATDDILVSAGTGITIDNVTSSGFKINSAGGGAGGGATVTTSDVAPTSPVDGDLWWKSNEGRLKVYYADGNSNQWIDASPPLAPTSIISGNSSVGIGNVTSGPYYNASTPPQETIIATPSSGNHIQLNGNIEIVGNILPSSNESYDLGSAEYKIRHLFLSDNSLWVGDENKVAIDETSGVFQVRKRKKESNFVPSTVVQLLISSSLISNASQAAAHALDWFNTNHYPGESQASDLSGITLPLWFMYAKALSAFNINTYPEPSSLFPGSGSEYSTDDYQQIFAINQPGFRQNPIVSGSDQLSVSLKGGTLSTVMYDPIGDFQVIVGDCEFTQGMSFEFDIYVKQVGTPRTISSMLVTRSDDGSAIASSQLRIIGTPSGSQVNTFMVRGVYLDGSWKVCVQIV